MNDKREENERLKKKLDQLNELLKSMIELSKSNIRLIDNLPHIKRVDKTLKNVYIEERLLKNIPLFLLNKN